MGREVRRVPENWIHPVDDHGNHIPLHDGMDLTDAMREWDEGAEKWAEGLRSDGNGGWVPLDADDDGTFEDWEGARPSYEGRMPNWPESERTHFMMYENTSEGTPISPAFATPEDLARWLADTGASAFADMTATYERWLRVARGGWAPTLTYTAGAGVRSGVEGVSDD